MKEKRHSGGREVPAAIQRLLDEVANESTGASAYNRIHNRHNRSLSPASDSAVGDELAGDVHHRRTPSEEE